MEKEAFYRLVYDIVKEIPAGSVVTYGQIARLAGYPQASRRVGQALFHAPDERGLPCHRVVNSSGRLAPGCSEKHRRLLEAEGVAFKKNGCVDVARCVWKEIVT